MCPSHINAKLVQRRPSQQVDILCSISQPDAAPIYAKGDGQVQSCSGWKCAIV